MRRPRFEREPGPGGLRLTARDLSIFHHIARHRFLNSQQIIALIGGSRQHVLKRLQRLFHAGYIDRPKSQVRYFAEDGSQPMVYALGRKGAQAIATPGQRQSRYDNRNIKQLYLQHTVLVAEVMVAFTRACQGSDTPRLLSEDDLAPGQPPGVAFRLSVTVRDQGATKRVGVMPDRVFELESPATGERVLYFLEADRATMPVTRRSLSQSSMLRKLLAYEATWTEGVHRDRFNCARFRVLVVTSTSERARHLANVCGRLSRGRGLFLFTDADALQTRALQQSILTLPWMNASGGTERLGDAFARKNSA
jgi:DNA-binding Lrp family transcriptional regulator